MSRTEVNGGIVFSLFACQTETFVIDEYTLIIDDFSMFVKIVDNSSKISKINLLYPSSSRDDIFVQTEEITPTNWQLINSAGQAINLKTERVTEHLWKMDIRTLAIGNYLLIATDNSKRLTFTFQKIE